MRVTDKSILLDLLVAAHAGIFPRKNWIQGSFAKDSDGDLADPSSPVACRFCASGAISAASYEVVGPGGVSRSLAVRDAVDVFRSVNSPIRGIAHYNDTHNHAKVVNAFERAIARLEREAA